MGCPCRWPRWGSLRRGLRDRRLARVQVPHETMHARGGEERLERAHPVCGDVQRGIRRGAAASALEKRRPGLPAASEISSVTGPAAADFR